MITTYITCWNRVLADVAAKEKEFVINKLPYFVINSATEQPKHWINIGDQAWCYRQLFETFKHARNIDSEYISVLFGDIYAPEGSNIIDYVKETSEKIKTLPDCFVYTTSFTHDGWSYPQLILKHHDEEIAYVCGTDTLYMTLHKNVYNFCADFLDYFDKKHGIDNFFSGWAVDVVCSLYSIYNRKNVFRNKKSILVHYENSGYNVDRAYSEMELIITEAINYMSENLGYNKDALNILKNMIMEQRSYAGYNYYNFY